MIVLSESLFYFYFYVVAYTQCYLMFMSLDVDCITSFIKGNFGDFHANCDYIFLNDSVL